MKKKLCPKCNKVRWNNSPYSYTWWHVMGHGYMCYACHEKLAKQRNQHVNDR